MKIEDFAKLVSRCKNFEYDITIKQATRVLTIVNLLLKGKLYKLIRERK